MRTQTTRPCRPAAPSAVLAVLLAVAPLTGAQGRPCSQCGPGPGWIRTCQAGTDMIAANGAVVGIDLNRDCRLDQNLVLVACPPPNNLLVVKRSNPTTVAPYTIQTEIVSLCLQGSGATLRAGQGAVPFLPPSKGAIVEDLTNPLIGNSYFDVFFEIQFGAMRLYNHQPLRLATKIKCVPPWGDYYHPRGLCIPLFTVPPGQVGLPVANLVEAKHRVNPQQAEPPQKPSARGGVAVVNVGFSDPNMGDQIMLFDPTDCSTRTCAFQPVQGTRGHTVGYDGYVYVSAWTVNGIQTMELLPCFWATVCADPTNAILGAPYQPVANQDAVGGPGLWCVDGNPPPAPCPTRSRNTALVDMLGGKCVLDCCFPDTFDPMTDAYEDPTTCGQFIGIGFDTLDPTVSVYPLSPPGGICMPRVLCRLPFPSGYDALMHEDCNIYVWHATPSFVGFTKVDPGTGTCTTCAVPIPYAGTNYAAVWNQPWEWPGRVAHVIYGGNDTHYAVDLLTCTVTGSCGQVSPGTWYNTAREVEEGQLTSWYTNRATGARNFHLSFKADAAGGTYLLLPNVSGCASRPLPVGSLELWFQVDFVTGLALQGALRGALSVVGPLDPWGDADVSWNLGVPLNLCAWWMAAAFDTNGTLVDLSNQIRCTM